MLIVRCVCGRSFPVDEAHTTAAGEELSVLRCDRCLTFYVAINTKSYSLPKLFKLTATKSQIYEEATNAAGKE